MHFLAQVIQKLSSDIAKKSTFRMSDHTRNEAIYMTEKSLHALRRMMGKVDISIGISHGLSLY